MTSKDVYDKAVSRSRSGTDDEESIRAAELAALVEMGLGYSLDQPTFNALLGIQAELQAAHEELDARFEAGALNPEEYLARFNAALRLSMERSVALLGNERFGAIFGDAGKHPDGLVDRETFLAQARAAPAR